MVTSNGLHPPCCLQLSMHACSEPCCGWACPQPCSWAAARMAWTDLSAQEDTRTRRVLLVAAGMTGLCPRGRSSQQQDGPVGDDPIVVICQSPPAPPVPGALLSTKTKEGWWEGRGEELCTWAIQQISLPFPGKRERRSLVSSGPCTFGSGHWAELLNLEVFIL